MSMSEIEPESAEKPLLPPSRGRNFFDMLMREGSAFLFSAALVYVLWQRHTPRLDTPDDAMWAICGVASVCFACVFLQAVSAVRLPIGRQTAPLADLVVSLIPVFIIGYTVIDWVRLEAEPSTFQLVAAVLASLAVLVDLIVFTWFSLRLNGIAAEIAEVLVLKK
jgi:hypothetical protein